MSASAALPLCWVALVIRRGWTTRPSAVPAFGRFDVQPVVDLPLRTDQRPRRHRLRIAAAVALALLPFAPVVAPFAGLAALWLVGRRQRARDAGIAESVAEELPEVVDLLALAVSAGLTVPAAIGAVGRHGAGAVAEALAATAGQIARGRRCADAVDELPSVLGDEVRPLVAALLASERHGAPLAAGLDRLADDLRAARRRRAEAAARRIPVQLLFPLVCCVLPAFALLTVAPLLAGALRSLRL